MSLWLDEQFVNRMSYVLDGFVRVKQNLYNIRCPICGDSQTHKNKKRGYFFAINDSYRYQCHNCGASMTLRAFIRLNSPMLYDEYSLEAYKEKSLYKTDVRYLTKEVELQEAETKPIESFGMRSVSSLDGSHPVRKYVESRLIPVGMMDLIYYAPRFNTWNHQYGGAYKPKQDAVDHPRLVFPYFWFDESVFRFNSRAFGNEAPRYQQTILDHSKPRLYGLERVNTELPVYVLEGNIDSLFLPNAVAVGNANYGIPYLDNFKQKIYIPDNQPRNPDVVRQIEPLINSGKSVVLLEGEYGGKDINEMVKAGLTISEIVDILERSTYSGIAAQMKFAKWRKD